VCSCACGKRAGHRRLLEAVGLQLLDGGQPLVLVHRVARDQEREHVPDAGVLGELVEARGLQAALDSPR
jgi:hypothetical protein